MHHFEKSITYPKNSLFQAFDLSFDTFSSNFLALIFY